MDKGICTLGDVIGSEIMKAKDLIQQVVSGDEPRDVLTEQAISEAMVSVKKGQEVTFFTEKTLQAGKELSGKVFLVSDDGITCKLGGHACTIKFK